MIRKLLVLVCLISGASLGSAAPASEASVRELLAVTEARKLTDSILPQIDGMIKNSMPQALGRALSPDEQQFADALHRRVIAIVKEELSWESLEPVYIEVYQKSFTQEELDGILAFYKTPAGIAMTKKMPVVMQQSMALMQQKMAPMMRKVQAAVEDTVREIQAAKEKQAGAADATPANAAK